MSKLVGHTILHLNGPGTFAVEGEIGEVYNYIHAGNGCFIDAENEHLHARVPVAEFKERGLPLAPSFTTLKHGRIPQRFWDLALSVFLASPEVERYVGIRWDGRGYALYIPAQESEPAKVKYATAEDIVVDLHSHPGELGPIFSPIDDADEQGFRIYGVVGDFNAIPPSVNFRVGVYGYWVPVSWGEVFEGDCGIHDVNWKGEENNGK
jgi:hypothetical protein